MGLAAAYSAQPGPTRSPAAAGGETATARAARPAAAKLVAAIVFFTFMPFTPSLPETAACAVSLPPT
ncbi:Uncharacterised protein [Mycobacterium tuberculosis]|nr:Uncharacterised protein [Mycobacterium tuberculosis]